MLTHDWQPLSDLSSYGFNLLDEMWQRGEIECRIELLYRHGRACGCRHYYRLKETT